MQTSNCLNPDLSQGLQKHCSFWALSVYGNETRTVAAKDNLKLKGKFQEELMVLYMRMENGELEVAVKWIAFKDFC